MKSKGFTLIELLIVVAIIAILAAIAVPNFLEAQTRAKIARGKADMRSVATALETYMIDNNKYPFDWDSRGWPYYLTDCITTPIAYLTSQLTLKDTFRPKAATAATASLERLRYLNYPAEKSPTAWPPCPFPGPYKTRWGGDTGSSAATINKAMQAFGPWKLTSAGPDKTVNTSFFLDETYYDATNGTVSGGDIVFSAKGLK